MKTIGLQTFLCLTLLLWLGRVESIEDIICAGLGYSNETETGKGSLSMGASEWFAGLISTFWGANPLPKGDITKNVTFQPEPILNVTRVFGPAADGTIRELNGWLRIRVSRHGVGNEFAAIGIWVTNFELEPYGHFVFKTPSDDCKGGESQAREFVPCTGTPLDTPLNPNMFVWTIGRENPKPLLNEVNLLWKADQTYCNNPEDFRVRVAVTNTELNSPANVQPKDVAEKDSPYGAILYQTTPIYPSFYGAASPIFDKTELSCNESANHSVSFESEWTRKRTSSSDIEGVRMTMADVYYKPRWTSKGSTDQDTKFKYGRQICRLRTPGFMNFGGRCNGSNREAIPQKFSLFPNFETPPQCRPQANTIAKDDFSNFFEQNGSIDNEMYFNEYIYRLRKPEVHKTPCDCPPIPTPDEVKARAKARQKLAFVDATPYQEPDRGCTQYIGKPAYHKHGLCLRSVAGKYAHGVRQWHAITNLFCCMVLIPISCFTSRYLKGEIPVAHDTLKPHIPTRGWYLTHVLIVLPIVCMYASGMSSIRRQLKVLGFSRTSDAGFHRVCGFVIMGLFGFQCLFGFLRPLNISWRKFAIFIHWFFGYVVYYFGAVVCILTYRIPASPFSFHKVLDPQFSKIQYHVAPLLMICWLVIDLILHICITIYVVHYDRARLGVIKRTYFPVFLPMRVDNYYLRTHDYDDIPHEDKCLQKTFYGYCVFCFCFFLFTMVAISYLNLEYNHGYGPMQCTHDSKNMFTAGITKNMSEEDIKIQQQFCKL